MASFEAQLAELEKVVARMEEGGLPLEESVTLFETGLRLSNACKQHLSSAESRIRVLLEPERGGEVRTEELAMNVAEGEAADDGEGYEEDAEDEDGEDVEAGDGRL